MSIAVDSIPKHQVALLNADSIPKHQVVLVNWEAHLVQNKTCQTKRR
jgi:hypothetical protein